VHTGVLKVDGKKMSKSLGNFVTVRDALKRYDPEVLRFFFASAHYRSIIDFSEASLEQAQRSLQTLRNALSNVQKLAPRSGIEKNEEELEKKILRCRDKFVKAMDDDFNSPFALTALFDLANEINKFVDSHETINANLLEKVVNAFRELGGIFNILQKEEKKVDVGIVGDLVDLFIELRQEFRETKDWQMSDKIRSRLRDLGIILEDTAYGTRWRSVS